MNADQGVIASYGKNIDFTNLSIKTAGEIVLDLEHCTDVCIHQAESLTEVNTLLNVSGTTSKNIKWFSKGPVEKEKIRIGYEVDRKSISISAL